VDRRYRIFDVFTDRALCGNPLAVVLDCNGLEGPAMQRIAGEFNLSETVFVMPAGKPAHSARIRIFTPTRELPFAGHPTVGTAVCLALERFGADGPRDAVVVLEEDVGPVRCGVKTAADRGFAEFDCPRLPERIGEAAAKGPIASALGLQATEIGFENHVPTRWAAGVPYHFVPVRNMGVLAKATARPAAWRQGFPDEAGVFLYTRDTEGHDHSFRARMFAPELGIAEDPATGSAVAALAGPVHAFDELPDGTHVALVEQGYDMGRPSLIRLEMTVSGGALSLTRIGGNAVRFATGVIDV
jgi:trans-2,3-dihydro-3-hydroxyanthranilate isomerase